MVDYCISSHGGSGYAMGSYWDGNDIICGICGGRITNPSPTGGRLVGHKPVKGILGWLHIVEGEEIWAPTWPDFIIGHRGEPWKGDPPKTFSYVVGSGMK